MEARHEQNLHQQLAMALAAANSDSNEERNQATRWILELKRTDPKNYTFLLIAHLSNSNNPTVTRALSAVLIYNILHMRTNDSQRRVNHQWVKNASLEIREQLRQSSTMGLFDASDIFSTQCANLLALFYAVELIHGQFQSQFNEMLNIIQNSPNIQERITGLEMLKRFTNIFFSTMICYKSDSNIYGNKRICDLITRIFDILLAGMQSDNPELCHACVNTLLNPLKFFERPINFPRQRAALMQIVLVYLQSPVEVIVLDGYLLARQILHSYYSLIDDFIPSLIPFVQQALNSGSDEMKIQACLLLQDIGDVESNIHQPEINAACQSLSETRGFSGKILESLFIPLVMMICDCPIQETEAKSSLDRTPQTAAFSCFSNLVKATDQPALKPIFDFVQENGTQADWRLRFASVMLLNAATRLPSFSSSSNQNYLIAYNFFCQLISDEIPRVVEVSLWSLGRIIQDVPQLVVEPQRFAMIVSRIPAVLQISSTLAARCCWLLDFVFEAFHLCNETAELLGNNFEQFSDMLLMITELYETETIETAYNVINNLVIYAPNGIYEKYNTLFKKVTAKLGKILQTTGGELTTQSEFSHINWICYIVQTITIFVGERISNISNELMQMLLQLISKNGILIPEVLNAIGAIARAIKENFSPYAQRLIPFIVQLLKSPENLQPAALIIGDLYSSLSGFPSEVTQEFVELLLEGLNSDDISKEARNAILNVLGTQIAQNIGSDCQPWLDIFLSKLESESKAALEDANSDGDEYLKMIHLTVLLSFTTVVPILEEMPNGLRKVKSFFYIFEQIYQCSSFDIEVLTQVVILLQLIAQKFGRKLNALLHRPAVTSLLEEAKAYDELSQSASDVTEFVKNC